MNLSCPICRVIEGKRPGCGKICKDCVETEGISIRYDEFSVYRMIKQTTVLMTCVWPLMLVFQLIWTCFSHCNVWSIVVQVVCWATWVFNVFYLYPKLGVPIFGKWQKMEDARDKLFLVKLSGKRKEVLSNSFLV